MPIDGGILPPQCRLSIASSASLFVAASPYERLRDSKLWRLVRTILGFHRRCAAVFALRWSGTAGLVAAEFGVAEHEAPCTNSRMRLHLRRVGLIRLLCLDAYIRRAFTTAGSGILPSGTDIMLCRALPRIAVSACETAESVSKCAGSSTPPFTSG